MISPENKVIFTSDSDTHSVGVEHGDTKSRYEFTPESEQVAAMTVETRAPGVYELTVEGRVVPATLAILGSAAFEGIALEASAARSEANVFTLVNEADKSLRQSLEQALGMREAGPAYDSEQVIMRGDEVNGHAMAALRAAGFYRASPPPERIRRKGYMEYDGITQLSPRDAETILQLMQNDLRHERGEGPLETFVDQLMDKDLLAKIEKKLRESDDFRGAVEASGVIDGVSQSHEWYAHDQKPYAQGSPFKLAKLWMHDRLTRHRLPGHPLGIFAVAVSDLLPQDDQLKVADDLLTDIMRRGADSGEHKFARTGLIDGDPLLSVFESHRFEPTGTYGSPVPGISMQLYDAPIKKVR